LAANTARVKRMATGQVETLALTPGAFEEFLRKS
jgi:hypothetical protein